MRLWRLLCCSCVLLFRIRYLAFFLFIFASLLTIFFVCRDKQVINQRQLFVNSSFDRSLPTSFNSTCSLTADGRGANQKVIGYSIYGNLSQPHVFRQYLKPFVKTLKEIPIKYPGWIVRIYHNLTTYDEENWKILKNAIELGSSINQQYIDICNVTIIVNNRKLGDIFAMTWRWLPLLDDMVDSFMSRDSDSPIFQREVDAVHEWLDSSRMFHIMRDHPFHCRPIVGGCWGVKISHGRSATIHAAEKLFKQNHFHEYDYDQELLDEFVWPIARNNMIAHDSYCCEKFRHSSQPFPSKRKSGLFVGWREVGQPKEALKYPCPEKCRPKNVTSSSTDWSFC